MSLKSVLLLVVTLCLFPAGAGAFQGYVQPVGDGGAIAWGNGEVSAAQPLDAAEGAAPTPLVVRRAATKARKHLLDMILAVRIDARGTVSAYLSENDELAASVRGVVQNSPMERPAVFESAGEVRVSERFRGKLAELVLPTTIQFQSGIPPRMSTSMEQNLAYGDVPPEETGAGTGGYSGVIVDARGLKVTPALAPVIYGQDGLGAYGPFLVSRTNAIDKGVLAYADTADPAALRERVGDRPLVLRALSAFGSWRTDLVVSTPMGRLIRAMMRVGDAVDNCRVVVVLDPLTQSSPDGGGPEQGAIVPAGEQ
jgi:hypothetical protein